MSRRHSHTLALLFIASASISFAITQAAPPGTVTERILVDQFGYLPDAKKIAVLNDPQIGYNAAAAYSPGASMELRRVGTNALVHSAAPTPWNASATHAQSGDKVWWFDFSSVTAWGEYYVYDPTKDLSSAPFRIDERVYYEPLRQAARAFFYQRRGFAKQPPFADPKWADGASHLGTLQDSQCRLVTSPGNASLQRDLRGGWFDAGDYNKYVNFTHSVFSDLLFAYRNNPAIWTDDFLIEESNNGIPDLLDEVKWELDWLLRMQSADGSVLSKMGVNAFQNASPPSLDTAQIFYGPSSTSSTLSAASSFANAAVVFGSIGQTTYATTLRTAAIAAWTWANANPSVAYANTGFQSANPEVSVYERSMYKLAAGIYLYELTGEATYKSYVETNYTTAQPIQWGYWYAFETAIEDALLHYSSLPGATLAVRNAIISSKNTGIAGSEFLGAYNSQTDAYRAYVKDGDMVWGSNRVKSHVGILFANQAKYGIGPAASTTYRDAAAGYLHYLHGVNPVGITYLTNMYASGGDRCVNQVYHAWFTDGSDWDHALLSAKGPPPGYLTGGPNASYAPLGSYSGPPLVPPLNQPAQKAFLDWNSNDYTQESWEISEPGIYYQAAYLHLLSNFVRPLTYAAWAAGYGIPSGSGSFDTDFDGRTNLEEFGLSTDPTRPDEQPLTLAYDSQAQLTFPRQQGTANLTMRILAGPSPNSLSTALTITAAGTRTISAGTETETTSPDGSRTILWYHTPAGDAWFTRVQLETTTP